MATVDIKIWAVYQPWTKDWRTDISRGDLDMTDQGWVLLGSGLLEYPELTPEQLRVKTAEALRAELQKTRASHYKEEQRMEEIIQELLSLPAPKISAGGDDDIPF